MHEQLIQNVRKKTRLTDEEAGMLRQFFIPKKIRKRQYLLNAGDVCHYIAFVEKGLLRSFSVDENGQEHVIQFAMEGWWISDMGSFFSGEDSIYNIDALEDSEILLLTKQSLDQMMDLVPKMQLYFLYLMQNHIIALQRRITAAHSYTAEEMYLKLMEVQPGIISRASQQNIASYLGITPETLSRIRKLVAHRK